jgi:hypothetical protein
MLLQLMTMGTVSLEQGMHVYIYERMGFGVNNSLLGMLIGRGTSHQSMTMVIVLLVIMEVVSIYERMGFGAKSNHRGMLIGIGLMVQSTTADIA